MLQTSAHRDLLERLNAQWRVAGPAGGSAARRLVYRVRALFARLLLGPQETFNAAVVEYINTTLDSVDQALVAADDVTRHRESLVARERRMEASMKTILAAQDELRASIAVLQQATHSLTRQVARLETAAPALPAADVATSVPQPVSRQAVDGHTYVAFEDQFRGSAEIIRERLADYVPVFAGRSDVLDVGCGRGEFLALLRENGIRARGIDLNASMVDVCRDKGLDAATADALGYLRSLPAGALGGLFAAQVVEHLEPSYLAEFLEAAFEALSPGSPIVLETINPGCWFAFFESYLRDLTHSQPIHADTLKYLLIAGGFQQVEIRYRAPYPEADKLQLLDAGARQTPLAEQVETLNANVEKINRLLFTYLDYAAVGRRP